jgi:uncharacterized protein (TIGR02453 family)
MSRTCLPPSTFEFLRELREHNNREWFNAHKPRYQAELAQVAELAEQLLARMSLHDELEPMTAKQSLFRIYRDVRFSKDKSPYKTHFSGQMKRATKWRRGGYYFHFEPGGSFAGGGFWAPNAADLKRIREELAADARPLRELIAAPEFRETFGQLEGEQLKTAPQGYSADHPDIDLLRYKQFLLTRAFTDQEVTAPGFLDQLVESFRRMIPFFDYMSEVLTTDANGVPLEE